MKKEMNEKKKKKTTTKPVKPVPQHTRTPSFPTSYHRSNTDAHSLFSFPTGPTPTQDWPYSWLLFDCAEIVFFVIAQACMGIIEGMIFIVVVLLVPLAFGTSFVLGFRHRFPNLSTGLEDVKVHLFFPAIDGKTSIGRCRFPCDYKTISIAPGQLFGRNYVQLNRFPGVFLRVFQDVRPPARGRPSAADQQMQVS
jgi:hypothetical protein